MFTRILKWPWTGALLAIFGVAWEAALLLGAPIGLSAADRKWYYFWGLIALLICMTQAFGALISQRNQLAGRIDEIERARPRIQPKLPSSVHSLPISMGVTVPFLRIKLWNNPPQSFPKALARGVRAYVSFFPTGHSVASLKIDGRWSESDQPPKFKAYESKRSLLETTFGFGETNNVDIAYIDDNGRCFAWNNDNYMWVDDKPVIVHVPGHLLREKSYTVHVRIVGEMVDENFGFTFWIDRGQFRFTQPSSVPYIRDYLTE